MSREVEMALFEFVETGRDLKTFDGPAYKALAMQAAYYLGLNTDIVTKGENSSAICIGRTVTMFRPIEDTEHIQVEIVGPLYDLEGITFTYKKPSDIYPLVNMLTKAVGARGITEFQLLRSIQVSMCKAGVDLSFTYGEINENTYGVIMDVEYPRVEGLKVRFYIQAVEQDLETIATCKAEADLYDGLEAKNESASIVAKEVCMYALKIVEEMGNTIIRNGGGSEPVTVH